jgi:hypothetical protein
MFNHDYLPIRVAPISGLLFSFCSQLHFQSLFSFHVGNFGFTSFLTGETCLIRRTHTKLKLPLLSLRACAQGGVKALIP